jgi:hypothetical protein
MSADVVAWLESDEGQRWARDRCGRPLRDFGHMVPAGAFSTSYGEVFEYGPLDPRFDPCGRAVPGE